MTIAPERPRKAATKKSRRPTRRRLSTGQVVETAYWTKCWKCGDDMPAAPGDEQPCQWCQVGR